MAIGLNASHCCCCEFDSPAFTLYHNNVSDGNHFYLVNLGYQNTPNAPYSGSACLGLFNGQGAFPVFKSNSGDYYETCSAMNSLSGRYVRLDIEKLGIAVTGNNPTNTWIMAAKITKLYISGSFPSFTTPQEGYYWIYDSSRPMYAFGTSFSGHTDFSGAMVSESGTRELAPFSVHLNFYVTPYIAAKVVSSEHLNGGSQKLGEFYVGSVVSATGNYSVVEGLTSYCYTEVQSKICSGASFAPYGSYRSIGLFQTNKYCLDGPSGYTIRIDENGCRSSYGPTNGTNSFWHTGVFYDAYDINTSLYGNVRLRDITKYFPGAYCSDGYTFLGTTTICPHCDSGGGIQFASQVPKIDDYICYDCNGTQVSFLSGIDYDISDVRSFLQSGNYGVTDGYLYSGILSGVTNLLTSNYVPENPILGIVSVMTTSGYSSGTFPGARRYETNIDWDIWIYNNTGDYHCLSEITKSNFIKQNLYTASGSFSCSQNLIQDGMGGCIPPLFEQYVNIGNNPNWDIVQTIAPSSDFCAP